MKTRLVRYEIDLAELPPLTQAQKAEIEALAAMPDSEIDTSDIPEMTDEQFEHAIRGRFYKPLKTVTTMRVDSDVIAWFKSQGKGYQTRINAILRDAMFRSMKASDGASTRSNEFLEARASELRNG